MQFSDLMVLFQKWRSLAHECIGLNAYICDDALDEVQVQLFVGILNALTLRRASIAGYPFPCFSTLIRFAELHNNSAKGIIKTSKAMESHENEYPIRNDDAETFPAVSKSNSQELESHLIKTDDSEEDWDAESWCVPGLCNLYQNEEILVNSNHDLLTDSSNISTCSSQPADFSLRAGFSFDSQNPSPRALNEQNNGDFIGTHYQKSKCTRKFSYAPGDKKKIFVSNINFKVSSVVIKLSELF